MIQLLIILFWLDAFFIRRHFPNPLPTLGRGHNSNGSYTNSVSIRFGSEAALVSQDTLITHLSEADVAAPSIGMCAAMEPLRESATSGSCLGLVWGKRKS
ncbi:hypothetical protein BCCGELA001_27440 [Bradyrhizobium sp. CCGE-LA001]|nr:hypothetical protein BCCGELA001_27440 [Bradyrhizobium sp. CCGE-LA001]